MCSLNDFIASGWSSYAVDAACTALNHRESEVDEWVGTLGKLGKATMGEHAAVVYKQVAVSAGIVAEMCPGVRVLGISLLVAPNGSLVGDIIDATKYTAAMAPGEPLAKFDIYRFPTATPEDHDAAFQSPTPHASTTAVPAAADAVWRGSLERDD